MSKLGKDRPAICRFSLDWSTTMSWCHRPLPSDRLLRFPQAVPSCLISRFDRIHGSRLTPAKSASDVTRILSQIESGDPMAAEQLLPLVYDELRKLAAAKLTHETSGQSLQPTLLVHDAYVRLVDVDAHPQWNSRGHFLALPPKRCGGFWWNMRGASEASNPRRRVDCSR